MLKQIKAHHFNIYYVGLILLVASLPVSVFTLSVSQFVIGLNWLLEGNWKSKWNRIKNNKALWFFLLIYAVHLLGVIHTTWPEGFIGPKYNALKDLKIKVPMLIIPIVIASSEKINPKQLKILFLFLVASVTVNSLISTAVWLGVGNMDIRDIRDISMFISHIRFALLINLSIVTLGFYVLFPSPQLFRNEKWVFGALILWLCCFLVILQSLTGLVILVITATLFIIQQLKSVQHLPLKMFVVAMMLAVPLVLLSYLAKSVAKFRNFDTYKLEELDKLTPRGNKYRHNPKTLQVENGHWIDLYVCEKELREEWNKVSEIPFDSLDHKGQGVMFTLTRYLTSLDLRKDADGVRALKADDIQYIENGYTNHIFKDMPGLYTRLYETIWEIDLYMRGGGASGHSIAQRIEYLKAASGIIANTPWVGVGTGDAQLSFNQQYIDMGSKLRKDYWHRAHNQFVTFVLTFGFIGFAIVLFAMLAPLYFRRDYVDFLFVAFLSIAFFSMLNEDTLETQPGVMFFTFFYSLLLFGRKLQTK